MKKTKYILLSILTLGFMACENEELQELRDNASQGEIVVSPELISGDADFSNYVAIGPSFTAGITDNGLFIAAQENSFPNILSKKFAFVGGGDFVQPMTSDNFGGLALNGTRIADPRLVFGGAGPVPLESVTGPVTVTTDLAINNPTGPFNNLGVPGAKSFHFLANGYGNIANLPASANPYAVRMTGSTPDASVLELAVAQNPTFFTADLIGGNDVLGYATSGGDTNIDQITDTATFNFAFNTIIQSLTANGAKGAVTNIPYVSSLPYFTAVGHDVVPLDQATADLVNAGFTAYNNGLLFAQSNGLIDADEVAQRTISFAAATNNAVVIEDENLTDLTGFAIPSYRQATSDDLVVLPASSFIGTTVGGNPTLINGVSVPLADRWILTPEEQLEITTAVDAYNATIATVASSNGLALVDVNAILTEASTTGIAFDDYLLNSDLVFGGLVSLDGIHLTARGYALMANAFLEAIDATYGSNFVESGNVAKAGDYPTNYSPLLQ
jgi:hypothetical protein